MAQVQQAEDTASMGGESDEGSGWETASDEEEEEGEEVAAGSGAGPMAEDDANDGAHPRVVHALACKLAAVIGKNIEQCVHILLSSRDG